MNRLTGMKHVGDIPELNLECPADHVTQLFAGMRVFGLKARAGG